MAASSTDRKLIIAANRGPISHKRGDDGEIVAVRGGGGLVTALLGMSATRDLTWIASAMTPEDGEVAAGAPRGEITIDHDEHRLGLRYVVPAPEVYDKFYNIIANPLIWFIQHYLWDLPAAPDIGAVELDAWENGYQTVNHMFADAICDKLESISTGHPLVMLHDYHLYTCPAMIRERRPDAFLHQFIHIPWPQSDSWRVLPAHMREAVIKGALSNDIIAFHTRKYVHNFLEGCRDLLDLDVDHERGAVSFENREVLARAYPVSIDCEDFERLAESPAVLAEEDTLKQSREEHIILRVDRMDLSKNIVRGFEAYRLFLERHPEFHGKVTFLALMQPSRQDIPQYAAYRERIEAVVEGVNTDFGNTSWQPVDVRMQDNFPASVAAYKQYDALLVNAVFDGMNLIAKEAGLINQRDGVLILSENTGAHEELSGGAISINPFDIEEQAQAIHRALTMADDEKKRMAGMLKKTVREDDIRRWIDTQFSDINARIGGPK